MRDLRLILSFLLVTTIGHSQTIKWDKSGLEPINVTMSIERLTGKETVRVIKDSTVKEIDEPTFVKVKGIDFRNGTIEVNVLSRLLKNAPDYARGFIGIAFRINDSNSKFESIYIRPTNGRADNQLRRNRSVQYFSFPDYKFDRLRKDAPGEYESYADMGLDEWIKIRIEVKGQQAKLFLNDNKQPTLIVNDLKHGDNSSGTIGLWVDIGTEGFFSNLKVTRQ
ncbi:MAG: hypothetical protein Q8R50_10415 [Sediminibacterium sp.]|nr:hypothetical protein [Sediminibacterium sp.]